MIRPRHRALPEILARAKAELDRNPEITVYGWRDGREHNRRQAEPWAIFWASMQKLGQAFIAIRPEVDGFRKALQSSLAAMPAGPIRSSGVPVPEEAPQPLSVAPSLSLASEGQLLGVGVCDGCGLLRFDCRMVEVEPCVRVRLCSDCRAR